MRSRTSEDAPDFRSPVSEHSLAEGVSVIIYTGLIYTFEAARKRLTHRGILVAYRHLSGDVRLDVSLIAATNVVLGEVQNAWYLVNGKDIPLSVMSGQELRFQEALMAKAVAGEDKVTTKAAKEPRVTNRSIIEAGLLNGDSDDTILAAVKEQFPEGKADSTHVRYYRHFLEKQGKLEKSERKPRVKKEKAEKVEKVEAAPVKKTASAPVKAGTPQKAGVGAPKPGRQK